jgi:hypothetical protein
MRSALTQCPVCGNELAVTRLQCLACDTTIEGSFATGPFAGLTPEQLNFVWTFVRCEGKFNRMEKDLGLSYPTLRNRLNEIIRAMGYEPGAEEGAVASQAERQQVLDDLAQGRITAEQAVGLLSGG